MNILDETKDVAEKAFSKETSKKFRLSIEDLGKSFLTSIYVAFIATFGQMIEAWISNPTITLPFNKVNFILCGKAAFAGFVGEIWRRYLKPSQTIVKITPPLKEKNNE